MSRKTKWKRFGKNTAEVVVNLGKAVVRTASVAVGNEKNDMEENGKSKLKNAWTKTGKGFGKAGKSLGEAIETTVAGDKEEEVKEEAPVEEEAKTEEEPKAEETPVEEEKKEESEESEEEDK